MAIKNLYSDKISTEQALQDITNGAEGFQARMVVCFASPKHDIALLSDGLKAAFGDADVVGCTSSGEITSGKMLKQSVVVMLMDSSTVNHVCVQIVENAKGTDGVSDAVKAFEDYYQTPMLGADVTKYLGLALFDGLSLLEERTMEKLGDLTDVLFIGGSAGDDLAFKQTTVFANGKAYNNASILALVEFDKGFEFIKTQSFKSLNKVLKATKVDTKSRTVHEFNCKPAVQAYAELLGVDSTKVSEHFASNPVGLMVEGEPFVRSPQATAGDSIAFYCNIQEGMDLYLLESTDIVAETKSDIQQKLASMGPVSGLINFHCILRTLELEQKGKTEEYGAIFKDIPTIGFSTYGEAFIGHINQTSTILVIK